MDGSEAAVSAAVQTFADKPALALGAAYCAAWAAEAFDRYAEKPGCFTNDMSIDDLILVVINDAARHPAWKDLPFLAITDGAIFDRKIGEGSGRCAAIPNGYH